MSGTFTLILSTILLTVSVAIFRSRWSSKIIRLLVSAVALVLLSLSGVYMFTNYFTGAGINQAVIFHFRYGLEGAGFGAYAGLIAGAVVFAVLVLVIVRSIYRLLSIRCKGNLALKAAALALLLAAVVTNPANRNLMALYVSAESSDEGNPYEFAELYQRPASKAYGKPKNLVFLYLESLERTYLNENLFPGLAPHLNALQQQSRSFTDIRQVYGTGWTIGGMVASQCGLPLLTPDDDEDFGSEQDFLPGAVCLGDVLADSGYQLAYMGGADLEFAGKGRFYETHGFTSVQGQAELKPEPARVDYQSSWGLYDDTLFRLALSRLEQLATSHQPFGLFLLTLDTHHNGHMSDACRGLSYGEGDNPILNAVHCTDKLVAGFIEAIRRSPAGRNTLIVLASDHLAMRNSAWEQLRGARRRNLLMLIDPEAVRPVLDASPGSTLDTAPTVLSRLGLRTRALGLGRDLLSDQPSLVEREQDVNILLQRQRPFIIPMWERP